MSATFTMYSTPWCGYCHRLKSQLDREGIPFEIVDIEQQPEAAHVVALFLDHYVEFSVADLAVPFAASWSPGALAAGIVAAYLLVAIEVASYRHRTEVRARQMERSCKQCHVMIHGSNSPSGWAFLR